MSSRLGAYLSRSRLSGHNPGRNGRRRWIAAAALIIMTLGIASFLRPAPAHAAISFRSSSVADNGAGSINLTITTPTGAAAGDVLVVVLAVNSTAATHVFPNDSGWNLVSEGSASGSSTVQAKVYYMYLSSAPLSSYSFYVASCAAVCDVNVKAAGVLAAYTGVSSINPVDLSNSQSNNSASTTYTAPSITTTGSNEFIVALYGAPTGATYTAGSSTTLRGSTSSSAGSAGSKATVAVEDKLQSAAGASGTVSINSSSSAVSIGFTLALNPVTPDAPTLSTPASGAISVVQSPSFTFRTTDADSDYLRYKLVLYQSDCTTVITTADETASQTGWSGQDQQTGTAYTGSTTISGSTMATYTYQSTLSPGTTYCWKAQAIEPNASNVFGPASATQSFTTDSSPASPVLYKPSDKATQAALIPVFNLVTSDVDSDYLRYKLVLYQSDCTTVITTADETASQTGWSGQDQQTGTAYTGSTTISGSTMATYTYQSTLSPGTTYCWKAQAIDPGGSNAFGGFSNNQFFTTATATANNVILKGNVTLKGGTHFGN